MRFIIGLVIETAETARVMTRSVIAVLRLTLTVTMNYVNFISPAANSLILYAVMFVPATS